MLALVLVLVVEAHVADVVVVMKRVLLLVSLKWNLFVTDILSY